MKASSLIVALTCLFIAATSAAGQGSPEASPKGPSQSESGGETRLLQHLLQMNDAELANLRQTVQRIEKMSPQEKAQLRERIGKFANMAPGKVVAMRQKFEAIPKEQREAMIQRWMEMSPEERAEWRVQLNEMSPAERKILYEEEGFMLPPRYNRKKGPRAKRPDGKGLQSERGPNANAPLPEKEIQKNKIAGLTE